MSGIPIPDNDWLSLNIRLDELSKNQGDLQGQVTSLKTQIQLTAEEATIIEEAEIEEEEKYDGPGNVFFIDASCSFTGEWPILYWEKLEDADMKYEIRTDVNFGKATNLILVTSADNYTVKQWKGSDGRVATFYLKALDTQNRYSREYDTITLTNVAPDMSAVTPLITSVRHGTKKDYKVNWKSYTSPSDSDGYDIHCSAESVCTISDDTKVGEVGKNTKIFVIKGLERGPDYDVRIVPTDVFGDGTPTN